MGAGGDAFMNIAGRVVGGLAALESLRSPGGLGRFILERQGLLADPAFRETLTGSPFTSGFVGAGGERLPPNLPSRELPLLVGADPARIARMRAASEGGAAPGSFVPTLPPLGPGAALKEALARGEAEAFGGLTETQRARLLRSGLGITPTIGEQMEDLAPYMGTGGAGTAAGLFGGTRFRPTISAGKTGPRVGLSTSAAKANEFDLNDPTDVARAELYVKNIRGAGKTPLMLPTSSGTYLITPQTAGAGTMSASDLAKFLGMGGGPPAAAPGPQPGGAPPARPSAAAPAAPTLPDDLPLTQLPLVGEEPRVGYPSPAFSALQSKGVFVEKPIVHELLSKARRADTLGLPGYAAFYRRGAENTKRALANRLQGETRVGYPSPAFLPEAPTRPPAGLPPPAGPPQLPAGTSITVKGAGGVTATRKGPSLTRQAAVTQRQLSLLTTAAQAADQALEIVKAGPQHELEAFGTPFPGLTPRTLAGPVTGRALLGLETFSGQPLAQEAAKLDALLAHARSGVTSLTGVRFTKEQMALFEPLMPNIRQPTEILAVHLQRLSRFYRSLADQQAALASLTPEQQRAMAASLFVQTMTGADEQPGGGSAAPGAPAGPLDLR